MVYHGPIYTIVVVNRPRWLFCGLSQAPAILLWSMAWKCGHLQAHGSELSVHLAYTTQATARQAQAIIADGTLDAIQGPELGPHGQGTTRHTEHSATGQVLIQSLCNLAQETGSTAQATQT